MQRIKPKEANQIFFVAAGNEKQQQELIMNFFIVFNLSNQPEVI